MFDAKNKLEIIAVKIGLKPAFQEFRQSKSPINPDLQLIKQLAVTLGLKYKSTTIPPPYFSRKPRVDSSFLDDYYNPTDYEALWIYEDPRIERKIAESVKGKLNEGHILGYPECCIKWRAEARVLSIEAIYEGKGEYAQRIIDEHLLNTWKRFPFVPHWACTSCLSGRSRKTKGLNNEYRELARKVSWNFEKAFIDKVRQFLNM